MYERIMGCSIIIFCYKASPYVVVFLQKTCQPVDDVEDEEDDGEGDQGKFVNPLKNNH